MKLRRALAAAAATAVIAPVALLSAPAAFATGDANDASTTPSASASETPPTESPDPEDPADPGDGTKPGDDGAKPEDPTKPEDPAEPGDGTKPEDPAKPGDDTKPGDGDTDPGADIEPGDDDATEPDDEATPTDEPTECAIDEETGEDAENQLELRLKGLPGKIVAGSGWHEFKLIAANPSDEDLGEVRWLAAADNFSESEDEKDWLSSYTRIQFYDPEAKGWKSIVDEVESGVTFGTTTLGAKEQVEIKLRLNINKKAPAGDGYAFGLGGYVDSELNCEHNAFAFFDFSVLKPGSDIDHPGEAIPRPDVTKPPVAKKPQGGRSDEVRKTVAEIPPTGSLAQTGSSSVLPTIGIVGGIAVVAGAGAVYVVRRRSHSDAAA
ncbi:hypothetical protein [Streptomyces flavofungini]|uniref:hypothetical protein n=1 Tax=Streptomyces flavofungini TaxID=68200 RepID=UPI0019868A95|nr:hypothetical protein [Streptomyces flavofungini]GHC69928.1 hypothetical protein GCM10010349_45130 [Streptomyces flavofungini]